MICNILATLETCLMRLAFTIILSLVEGERFGTVVGGKQQQYKWWISSHGVVGRDHGALVYEVQKLNV